MPVSYARRVRPDAVSWPCAVAMLVATGCGGSGNLPGTPSDVTAEAGPGTLTVSWTDNSDDETGFALLRATDAEFEEIATVPADTTTYEDADVNSDSLYTYKVVAVFADGRSDPSEPSPPVRPHPEGAPIVDPDDPVGVTLNTLGIDTTASPRLDENAEPLPDDYSPLGPTVELGVEEGKSAQYELFIGGTATTDGDATSHQVLWKSGEEAGEARAIVGMDEEIFTVEEDLYQVAAGDFDGDGLDELVMVSVVVEEMTEKLIVSFRDDSVAEFAAQDPVDVTSVEGVESLDVLAGDFDGDGTETLAVALGKSGSADLLFLQDDFAVGETRSFDASVDGAGTMLALASGNLDHDGGEEIAVVINERFTTDGADNGVSRYVILDDANADFAPLTEVEFVQGQDGPVYNALAADVALGDIDGDGRDEVVLGGLTQFHDTCEPYDLLYIALDDALEGADLDVLGVKVRRVAIGHACSGDNKRLRFIHVETGDVDGDGVDEIVGGPMVFDDWSSPWAELGYIPARQMYGHEDSPANIGRSNSALEVIDMDGDGRSEIVHAMARSDYVTVFEVADEIPEDETPVLEWKTRWNVVTPIGTFENGSKERPMLVAANVDRDTMVAKAVPDGYQYTMTEPIIVAALAAAPCNDDISQNLDACGTAYGQGRSTGIDKEKTVTVSVSKSIGFKVQSGVAQTEATAKATLSAALSRTTGYSYELEKSIVYSTGPLEDAVIFATVPYDRFTYEVLQHTETTMIGKLIDIHLPRSPRTVLVERKFFNEAQKDGKLRIGDNVFQHTVGDPSSYRSSGQKESLARDLLSRHGRDTLAHGPVAVGQGSGATELEIDVSEQHSIGGALEIGFEVEAEAVAGGVLGGFTIGVSAEASFSWSSGTSTTYGGSVGNIADGADFADKGYSYGMLTYVYEDDDSGQQFEVIDYWVE